MKFDSIFWISCLLIITSLIGFLWNVWRTENHVINGSSVTIMVGCFVGLSLIFARDTIRYPWFIVEEVKEQADRTEKAANSAIEAIGIGEINKGYLPGDEADVKKQMKRGTNLLKSIYKDEYPERVKKLIEKGYLPAHSLQQLGIEKDIPASDKKPYFEEFMDIKK